jgi:tRNA pseudouridine55 synthase
VPGEPKVYEATIQFGSETDTDDRTGVVTRSAEPPTDDAIASAITQLTGDIDQVPPSYSAKQVEGTRAYAAARRGAPLELEPVRISVHSWTLMGRDGDRITARITCAGGTYIRALARDLGRLTNSAAHLAELRRTDSGPFSVRDAATMADIESGTAELHPLTAAVPDLAVQSLDDDELRRVVHGNPIASRVDAPRAALVGVDGELVAVADARDGELWPKAVFRDA